MKRQKSAEEIAQIRSRLAQELAEARKAGDEKLVRNLGHKVRYWDGKESKLAQPPGQAHPQPAFGQPASAPAYPDLKTLMKEAKEYRKGIESSLLAVSMSIGKEIKAGDLSLTLLSIGIMLAWQKRVKPEHLEKADLFCLGAGSALLVLENWREFAGNKSDSGSGTESERENRDGVGQHSADEKPVYRSPLSE